MKKEKFSLLVSAFALLFFLFVGVSTVSAQSFTSVESYGLDEKSTDVSGVNFMPATEAIQVLEVLIKDDPQPPATDQEEAQQSAWTNYLTYLYEEISATSAVTETISGSKAQLIQITERFGANMGLDPLVMFQDAVDLLSN